MSGSRIADARRFYEAGRAATLCTHSNVHEGFPFGSVVQYDITEQARPVIYVSRIAQHFKNIAHDPRASLFIPDPNSLSAPLSCPRITLLVEFARVPEGDKDKIEKSYLKRFPDAVDHRVAHDFEFFVGELMQVRWIGGFGDIAWIGPKEFSALVRDAIAYHSAPMIEHMNEDHKDALAEYVNHFSTLSLSGASFKLSSIDRQGFTVRVFHESRVEHVKVAFEPELGGPEEVRGALISLLQEIRGETESS